MKTAIKGLLLDKDGTLLDYAGTWMPANRQAARLAARGDEHLAEALLLAAGYEPATDRVQGGCVLAAGTTAELATLWQPLVTGWESERLAATLEDLFVRHAAEAAVPVRALGPTLAALARDGYVLGVATSDSAASADLMLEACVVSDYFAFVAGCDSGHGHKPGPGMVHGFCAATGLDPATVAVVGDNPQDIAMGRAARCALTVGVLTGTGERADLEACADHVIEDLSTLPALLAGLAGPTSPG